MPRRSRRCRCRKWPSATNQAASTRNTAEPLQELDADRVGGAPAQLRLALLVVRDGEVECLGQACGIAEDQHRALVGEVAHDAFERADAIEGQDAALQHATPVRGAAFRPVRLRDTIVNNDFHGLLPLLGKELLSMSKRNACQATLC